MNIFLLGGWVARPSAFYFVAFPCLSCLILFGLVALCRLCSALLFVVALPYYVRSAFRGRLACSLHSRLTVFFSAFPCLSCLYFVARACS